MENGYVVDGYWNDTEPIKEARPSGRVYKNHMTLSEWEDVRACLGVFMENFRGKIYEAEARHMAQLIYDTLEDLKELML